MSVAPKYDQHSTKHGLGKATANWLLVSHFPPEWQGYPRTNSVLSSRDAYYLIISRGCCSEVKWSEVTQKVSPYSYQCAACKEHKYYGPVRRM